MLLELGRLINFPCIKELRYDIVHGFPLVGDNPTDSSGRAHDVRTPDFDRQELRARAPAVRAAAIRKLERKRGAAGPDVEAAS